MKTKLKIIIPTVIAIIAVIIAAVCISFSPNASQKIDEMLSTAQKYLVEQNYEQAVAEFNKIIELDPMNADAYLGLAQAYIDMGDTEKAVETLEKGFEVTGDERLKKLLDELLREDENTEEIPEASSSEITEATEITSVVTEEISYTDEELTAALRELVKNPDADIEKSKLDSIKAICIWGNDLYYASSSDNAISGWVAFDVSGYSYSYPDYFGISFNNGSNKELTFAEFTNLDFIKRFPNVKSIDVSFGNLNDISAVSEMTEITYLCLSNNPLYDISALSNLVNLTSLDLSKWNISKRNQGIIYPLDISVLSNLNNLSYLNLEYNGLTDINCLCSLSTLQHLNLSYNQITNISALSDLSNLKSLLLMNNRITDITALSNLSNLSQLWLSGNAITDISALSHLSNLTVLHIDNNDYNIGVYGSTSSGLFYGLYELYDKTWFISDFSPLYELKQLNELHLSDVANVPPDEYFVIINDDEKSKLETELPNCKIEYIPVY